MYNLNVDETDNFLTIISPGIWVGYPRTKEIIAGASPHNASAGGSRSPLSAGGAFNRFKAYLLGGMDHKIYSENSDLDATSWRIKGMFQYALPAGLSFRVSDQYLRERDKYDIGSFLPQDFTVDQGNLIVSSTPSRIRDYYSNRASLDVNLDMSERFNAGFNYTNFFLDYDDNINNWLNRSDNQFSGSVSFKYSPKTSYFVGYSQAFISYETDTSNDSEYANLYGGINWKGSAKTSLSASGGYQVKKYDNIDKEDHDSFMMNANLYYLLTDKTKISLGLDKSLEESDSLSSRGKDSIAATLTYSQEFTYRMNGYCNFRYQYNDYEGFNREDNDLFASEARKDTLFKVKPGIRYQFRDWLMTELAYSFENNNSNNGFYDFTSQTIFLSLNAAL